MFYKIFISIVVDMGLDTEQINNLSELVIFYHFECHIGANLEVGEFDNYEDRETFERYLEYCNQRFEKALQDSTEITRFAMYHYLNRMIYQLRIDSLDSQLRPRGY